MNIVYWLCVLYLQFSNSFALPNVNGCMIEEDSGTSVGTPTTDRESETTYSCVVPHNCTYEIHVIGNYESSNGLHGLFYRRRPGITNVYLRVTGQSSRPLILVLSSYEPVKWRLYSSVNIDRVILTGYYGSTVSVSSASIGQTEHMTGREHPNAYYAYGRDSGGGDTRELLLYLQQRFGPVSSFSGSYRADRWDLNINRAVEDGETCSFSTPSTPYTTPPPPVLVNFGGCMVQKLSGTSVGLPTTFGAPEVTYSCVVPNNCTHEIHVIGNYESSDGVNGFYVRRQAGDTDVYLTVSGQSSRPLILVLSSYEPVRWRLHGSVPIDRVIMTGYYGSTVFSDVTIGQRENLTGPGHPNGYSAYGSDSGGGDTRELLLYLQQRFGPVSSFSGSYRADQWDLNINRAVEDGETCAFSTPPTPPPPPVLVNVGGCMVQKLSGTSVGLPTTSGALEVTYSCVVPNNCTHEIHVIGNYESSDGVHGFNVRRQAGDTDVYLTVSGQSSRPLILVLSSYEPVRWRLHGSVPIDRVIMTGYYGSTIISDVTIGQRENLTGPGHPNAYYAYGSDSGGGDTRELLLYLQQRFGPVSSFSGSYRADRWDLNINREPGAAQSCSALLLPPSTDDPSEPDTSMPALVPVVTAISLTIVIGTFVIILCCILIKQRRRSVTYHQSRHPAVVVPTTTTQPLSQSIVPKLPTPPTAPVKESSFSAVSDPPPDYYIALNHPSVNSPPPYPTQ